MKKRRYLIIGAVVMFLLLSTSISFGSISSIKKDESLIYKNQTGGAELEVTTDKSYYYIGEIVTIFFTNIGDETLYGGGPILSYYNEEGELVYEEGVYCWWELGPGEYFDWTWDQKDMNNEQVPEGEYTVEGFLSSGENGFIDEATFLIITYDPLNPPYGPTEGVVNVSYTYCVDLPDEIEFEPYYLIFDWGDGTFTDWLGPLGAGETYCEDHSWSEPGSYKVRVGIKDAYGGSYWSEPLIVNIYYNGPPITPVIKGPKLGRVGINYDYKFSAADPDGDDIFYIICWGDNEKLYIYGPHPSGKQITLSYNWSEKGSYVITCRAMDTYNKESEVATLKVNMPRNNRFKFNIFDRFLARFPIFEVRPNLNTISSCGSTSSTENNLEHLDMWDLQFFYDVGGESGSLCLVGIGFDGTYFYCPEFESSLIHKFKKNGSYIGSFSISGVSNLMGLAYDGEYFYGAAQNSSVIIYEMDFKNEVLVSTITAPAAAWDIAYDSDDDAFWIGKWSNNLTKINRDGNVLDIITPPENILGIAYDNTFEYEGYNGPFLWIFTGTTDCPSTPATIKCIDIDTKTLVDDLEWNVADDLGPGIAGGLELTYDWDPIISVLIGIVQGDGIDDYALGYEIDWHWGPHDVGVKNIVSPEECDAAEYIEIIVQVRNHGNSTEENIPVNVVILKDGVAEEYNETKYVDVINPHETVVVEMPSWTPDDWQNVSNEYIDYKITAYATLWLDYNPSNDYKEKWFELYFGYFHDVGCTNVSGPESGPAQTFKVNATVKNFGQYDECCFKTYAEIAELDIDNQVELLIEDFSDSSFPPDGWTRTHSNWMYSNSNNAGGVPGEARFYYSPESTDLFRLYTSAIDTGDYDAIEIEFKQYVDHFTCPYVLQIETSEDGLNWDVVWSISLDYDVGPETITILFDQNVGSITYVSWTFNGNSSNINSWYVDDIVIYGYTSFDPEYEEYKCTTMIGPGEELVLEFGDWTPVFLAEETTGSKKYLVKAWTDMNNPIDENQGNDEFKKTVILKYYHDVGIKEVTSPLLEGDFLPEFYGIDSDGNIIWYDPETGFHIIGTLPNIGLSATFVDDMMWVCDTTGCIWIIDVKTCECEMVGNSGAGELVGLAYHEKSKTLYGCTVSDFYEIDMDTGHATHIGSLGCGGLMISIDCDKDGNMYGYDLNFVDASNFYSIDLDTGHATIIGNTGVSMNYGQDMAYDYNNEIMYATIFNYGTWQPEFCMINLSTGKFTYIATLSYWVIALAIPYIIPPDKYIPLGSQDIDVIVENIGTFPELDLTCYAEIYEYITNCTNGTLVYENNITDIDLDEPLGGTEMVNFGSYNFAIEGFYGLFLNLPDVNDDYPNNNEVYLGIGADGTPPVSNHSLDPPLPDGENDWYIGDIELTICAEDPSIGCGHPGSGVREIRVRINSGSWQVYEDECVTIIIHEDGGNILIEYYAIDKVGNLGSIKSLIVQRDTTKPDIEVGWEVYRKGLTWYVRFICEATDETSDINRVEMFINDELYENNTEPTYEFVIEWSDEVKISIFKFVAFDNAGNSDSDFVNGSDITTRSRSQSITHRSINKLFLRLLDRFPFLLKLLLILRGCMI